MKIFVRKNRTVSSYRPSRAGLPPARSSAGNVFFAVFAAVAMIGAVGYGFNTVLRGPVRGMTEVTKRTVAESTVITSARMAIVGATTQGPVQGGDCDSDGQIEPLPFFDAGANPRPTGGGWLPRDAGPPVWTLVPDSIDPWNNEYGYCAWDSGSVVADAGCGAGVGLLAGSPNENRPAIAVISAGRDRKFQTTCAAYNGADPNANLVTKAPGSDDIVLVYSYAEANNLGNGLWKPSAVNPTTASASDKGLAVTGGGTFSDKVVLTGGGLVLPGDPGDNSLTGPCDAANDRQMRRNTSTVPPTLEICDFTGGLGWNPVSGTSDDGGGGSTGSWISWWKLDETSGVIARDSVNNHHGTLYNAPIWGPDYGAINGALYFNGINKIVRVPRSPDFESTAFTFTAWVRRIGAQPTDASIFQKMYDNNTGPVFNSIGVLFDNTSDDQLQVEIGKAGGQNSLLFTNTLPDGVWTHIAVSYDPEAAAPQLKTYFNGVLDNSASYTDPIVYDTTSGGDLYLPAADSFNGLLDEVRFYNYALSDGDIAELYENSLKGPDIAKTMPAGKAFTWGMEADTLGANFRQGNGPAITATMYSPFPVSGGSSFVQVDTGETFSCGLGGGGRAFCWGTDLNGRLGNGANGDASYPLYPVANLTDIVKVGAGAYHGCALQRTGKVWCWGAQSGDANSAGLLGTGGTPATSQVPVLVSGHEDYVDLSVGNTHTCAIRHNGEAWCWGGGTFGQLGNGVSASSPVPVKVANVNDFMGISAAHCNTCQKTCGVTKTGEAYCWGTQTNGEFGNGATSATYNVPQLVSSLSTNVQQISTSTNSVCALVGGGEIWCAGSQVSGALGNGLTAGNATSMVRVSSKNTFTKVSTGTSMSCGLTDAKELWCWGSNTSGYLGASAAIASSSVPIKVKGENYMDVDVGPSRVVTALVDTNVKKISPLSSQGGRISVAFSLTCYIDAEAELWCWGSDASGQLGNGPIYTGIQQSPTPVIEPGKWKKVRVSSDHACAIKANGTLWCWGADDVGQLGNGAVTTANQESPIQIGTDLWSDIAAQTNSTCGIKAEDGSLWCWGDDTDGKLGNGASGSSTTPVAISEPGPWKKINMAGGTACAIKRDGSAWCWGDDTYGAVGDGNGMVDSQVPVQIKEPGPWIDVGAGRTSCGIKEDGSFWCWGRYLRGPGDVPEPIPADGNWAKVDVSEPVICAINENGSLWCGGDNDDGETGSGDPAGLINAPVPTLGGGHWVEVATSLNTVCGIKSDETVWCWGRDVNGNVGNGPSVGNVLVPYRVDFTRGPKWPMNSAGTGMGNVTVNCNGKGSAYYNDIPSGRCYYKSSNQLDWLAASKECEKNGGYLASITSARENSIITSNITLADTMWIGHNDRVREGVWVYGTGEKATTQFWSGAGSGSGGSAVGGNYSNWRGAAQPDNSSPTQNCGAIGVSALTTWDDFNCGENRYYLCEVPGNARGPATITIGNDRTITDDGATNVEGLGLTTPGGTSIVSAVQDTSGSQLLLKAGGAGNSSQLSFLTDATTIMAGPEQGLVGHWMLDEASGSTGADRINGSTATFYNTFALTTVGCKISGCAGFSGGANTVYARAGRSLALEPGAVTIAFWVRRSGAQATNAGLVNKDYNLTATSPYQSYGIGFNGTSDSELSFHVGTLGGIASVVSGSVITDNVWHHVVGTYDPSEGLLKFFINGAKVGTTIHNLGSNSAIVYDRTSNGDLIFGSGRIATGSERFNGLMDDIRIYNRALSEDEVATLYNTSENGVKMMYALGLDYASGNLEFFRNLTGRSKWATDMLPDLEFNRNGNMGVGTPGTVVAKVDVNGGVTVGNDGGSCTSARVGTLDYNSGTWRYCSDFGWQPFGSFQNTLYMPLKDSDVTFWTMCALRTDRSLWCWGRNHGGQLGNNTVSVNTSLPQMVHSSTSSAGWNDWVDYNNGERHTCGIRQNGTAWCWGEATNGRLGNGASSSNYLRPVQVKDNPGTGYWSDWKQISAGWDHTCAVRNNGTAWCWGNSNSGALGDNQSATDRTVPAQVLNSAGGAGWSDWVKVSVGKNTSCGLRVDGSLWCWGAGNRGELGRGTTANSNRPVQVQTSTGPGAWSDWREISAGQDFNCGLRTNNSTAYCWGAGNQHRPGNNNNSDQLRPQIVHTDTGPPGFLDIRYLGTAQTHGCMVRTNGTAWCWGGNDHGQGGHNVGGGVNQRPVQVYDNAGVGFWTDWVSITGGSSFSCGTRVDGSLWCWGEAQSGALGDGQTSTDRLVPVQVQ